MRAFTKEEAESAKKMVLARLALNYNRSKAFEGVMSRSTFYRYLKVDEQFAEDVAEAEVTIIHKAESKLNDLLESSNEKIVLEAIKLILNSKLGKSRSNFTKSENSEAVSIGTIEYKINK